MSGATVKATIERTASKVIIIQTTLILRLYLDMIFFKSYKSIANIRINAKLV